MRWEVSRGQHFSGHQKYAIATSTRTTSTFCRKGGVIRIVFVKTFHICEVLWYLRKMPPIGQLGTLRPRPKKPSPKGETAAHVVCDAIP